MNLTFILPYIAYCVEARVKTYKTITSLIVLLQKRAISIVNRADYRLPANTLFINSQAIKFSEAGDLNLASLVYTTTCYQTVSK